MSASCQTVSVKSPSITGGFSTQVARMVRLVFCCVFAKSGVTKSSIGIQMSARAQRTRPTFSIFTSFLWCVYNVFSSFAS